MVRKVERIEQHESNKTNVGCESNQHEINWLKTEIGIRLIEELLFHNISYICYIFNPLFYIIVCC